MSTTVTCPSCNAALRSNKPLASNLTVRCPSCGEAFQTASDVPLELPELPALPPPLPQAFQPAQPAQSNLPLLVFISGLSVVLVASIGLVVWLNLQERHERNKPAPVAAVDRDQEKRLLDERKRLLELEKKLEDEKNQLEQQRRKAREELDAAKKAPVEARAEVLPIANEDATQKKRQEEYNRLMQTGKDKMAAKDYDEAVTAFQSAVDLLPNQEAIAALADARKAAATNVAQQEKLKKYNELVAKAGQALQFTLFDDAIDKYQAALELIPGDPVATQGLQQARQLKGKRANAENKQQGIQQDLTAARSALGKQRFDEALAAVDRALKLAPNDADALALKKMIAHQQTALRAQYLQLMLQAQNAYQANRVAEAQAYFLQLNRLFPGDPLTALALDLTAANQWNYIRNLNLGYLALQQSRAQDAVRFFTAALLAFPTDPTATTALAQAQQALDKQNPQRGNLQDIVKAANQALQNRQWKEAARLWEAARDQSPLDPLVIANLAKARYELNMDSGRSAMNTRQYQAAIGYFQQALLQQPGDLIANTMMQQATALAKSQLQQPVQIPQVPQVPHQPANPQVPRNKGRP